MAFKFECHSARELQKVPKLGLRSRQGKPIYTGLGLDHSIVVPDGPASVFIRVGGPASPPSSTAPTGGLAPQRGVYTLGAIARSASSLQWRGP